MAKKALLIGVSQYEAGLPPLAAAPKDVSAMQRLLQSSELGAFDDVKTLIDPDLEAMQTEIDLLFQSCQKGDLGLLYFSGHGITDDSDRLYLATRRTSKDTFRSTAVSASFIQGIMRDRGYQRQHVLILDCCYSGAFAEGWLAKRADINLKPQLEVEGSVVLTSSTSTQKSYEDKEGELSLYTNYIVQGIESGAAESDGDGMISADELHEYAKQHVQATKPAMKPEIYGYRHGIKIVISQAKVNAELKYQRLVEEKSADNGEISLLGQKFLNLKRNELGLSDEVAIAIENQVLEPYRTRRENLTLYEQALEETCKLQFPLTEQTLRDLKDLQDHWGLRDEDINPIQDRVMTKLGHKSLEEVVNNPKVLVRWKFMVITGGIVFILGIAILIVVDKLLQVTSPTIIPTPSSTATNPSNEITSLNLEKLDISLGNPDALAMDGSTTMVGLIREMIKVYTQDYPKLLITYGINDVKPSGSSKGLENLINGTMEIAATSRKLNAKEEEAGIQSFQIGRDAIGIVVGINNPFKGNLTMEQLRNIYSGEIDNWSKVDGTNHPIRVINRGITSGTRDDFQDIVLRGQNFAPDSTNFITWKEDETTNILQDLGENGISYATVTQLKNQTETVRIIALDGVSPTDKEAVESGKYPIIRDIFLAVKKKTSPAAKQFIEFALSPTGQEILKKIGFTPIKSIK